MRTLVSRFLATLGIVAAVTVPPALGAAQTVPHGASLVAIEDAAVRVAPPPPPIEHRPARPFLDAVWTDGYWAWNGRAYRWMAGAWVRPEPGRRWRPWRWEERHGEWILYPGGWVPTHEAPRSLR